MISIPQCTTDEQRASVEALLQITGNPPTLEQMWACMDFVWDSLGCDNRNLDWKRIGQFYEHPVWLLNGLFIEQHELSTLHREAFAAAVKDLAPVRVADFGGGYGGLACMIAQMCPDTQVDIIEPHPSSVAIEKAADIKNLTFRPELKGEYDIIIATDVFEHITDPLAEVEKTSPYLKLGGIYMIANCFYPVIKCHLPKAFHFRYSFSTILRQMGLKNTGTVVYAQLYEKTKHVKLTWLSRFLESLSCKAYPFLRAAKVQPK